MSKRRNVQELEAELRSNLNAISSFVKADLPNQTPFASAPDNYARVWDWAKVSSIVGPLNKAEEKREALELQLNGVKTIPKQSVVEGVVVLTGEPGYTVELLSVVASPQQVLHVASRSLPQISKLRGMLSQDQCASLVLRPRDFVRALVTGYNPATSMYTLSLHSSQHNAEGCNYDHELMPFGIIPKVTAPHYRDCDFNLAVASSDCSSRIELTMVNSMGGYGDESALAPRLPVPLPTFTVMKKLQGIQKVKDMMKTAEGLLIKEKWSSAKNMFERVLKLDEYHMDAFVGLALCEEGLGDPQAAYKVATQILQMDSDHLMAADIRLRCETAVSQYAAKRKAAALQASPRASSSRIRPSIVLDYTCKACSSNDHSPGNCPRSLCSKCHESGHATARCPKAASYAKPPTSSVAAWEKHTEAQLPTSASYKRDAPRGPISGHRRQRSDSTERGGAGSFSSPVTRGGGRSETRPRSRDRRSDRERSSGGGSDDRRRSMSKGRERDRTQDRHPHAHQGERNQDASGRQERDYAAQSQQRNRPTSHGGNRSHHQDRRPVSQARRVQGRSQGGQQGYGQRHDQGRGRGRGRGRGAPHSKRQKT